MNGAFHYITISRFCQSKGNIPREIVPQEINFEKIALYLQGIKWFSLDISRDIPGGFPLFRADGPHFQPPAPEHPQEE